MHCLLCKKRWLFRRNSDERSERGKRIAEGSRRASLPRAPCRRRPSLSRVSPGSGSSKGQPPRLALALKKQGQDPGHVFKEGRYRSSLTSLACKLQGTVWTRCPQSWGLNQQGGPFLIPHPRPVTPSRDPSSQEHQCTCKGRRPKPCRVGSLPGPTSIPFSTTTCLSNPFFLSAISTSSIPHFFFFKILFIYS